ncbi:MAG: oligosaccharide flippase family protein, partial [Lachnospiraceae bacterium]|nr:oligosaccharide flippase family protein [Lachnospiraceae bacterium]
MRIYNVALILGSVTGGIAGAVVFIFAPKLAEFLAYPSAVYSLRVLGPTILVVAVLGVIRGLFQGKKSMVPTAVSQVFEQIINAIISIVAAVLFMAAGTGDKKAALGAAGGTFGTLSGAVAAVLFMMFIYQINEGYFKKQVRKDTHDTTFDNVQIFGMVFLTMLPIIISQLVYQLSGIIDTKIFGDYLRSLGVGEKERAALYEPYSNKYRQLTNIPIAIATALSAAIIPTLSGLISVGNQKEARTRIASSIKLNMIIAVPAAVGMGVLGPQIVYLLY